MPKFAFGLLCGLILGIALQHGDYKFATFIVVLLGAGFIFWQWPDLRWWNHD